MNSISCTTCGQVNTSSSRFCSRCGATLLEPQGSNEQTELIAGTKLRETPTEGFANATLLLANSVKADLGEPT